MPLPYPPNPYPGMPRGVEEDEQTLYGQEGVLWWRGLATEDDEGKVCKWAGELKEKLGVRRMIGGQSFSIPIRSLWRTDGADSKRSFNAYRPHA
jgi:hypothetical protein